MRITSRGHKANHLLAFPYWLVGDRMSAADVTAAAVLYRVRHSGVFDLPEGVDAIAGWVDRVMAYDRYLRPA